MTSHYDVYFSFRGKERKGFVRHYQLDEPFWSVGFTEDEILKEVGGMIYFYPDGTEKNYSSPTAKDYKDFLRAVRAQLR